MRIIAGRWKGRALVAPPGLATRPTSDRARQAIFDQLWHAPWAGRAVVENATVLDGFAGTGAMGLEALSRGAARVFFMEQDRAALAALQAKGWIAPGALIIAETGRDEENAIPPGFEVLSTRDHGAARLSALRALPDCGDAAS